MRIVALIPVEPQSVTGAAAVLDVLAEASRAEGGCRHYDVLASSLNPGTLVTLEVWADDAALASHKTQPHVGAAFAALRPLLSGPVQVHVLGEV